MIGAIHCWLVRLCGGKHKERRVIWRRKDKEANAKPGSVIPVTPLMLEAIGKGGDFNRVCTRCGAVRLARTRGKKT